MQPTNPAATLITALSPRPRAHRVLSLRRTAPEAPQAQAPGVAPVDEDALAQQPGSPTRSERTLGSSPSRASTPEGRHHGLLIAPGTLMLLAPRVGGPALSLEETRTDNALGFRYIGMHLCAAHLAGTAAHPLPVAPKRLWSFVRPQTKAFAPELATVARANQAVAAGVSETEQKSFGSRGYELHALLRYLRCQIGIASDKQPYVWADLRPLPSEVALDTHGLLSMPPPSPRAQACLTLEPLAFFLRAGEAPPRNAMALLHGYMQMRAQRQATLGEHMLLAQLMLLNCIVAELPSAARAAGEEAQTPPYPSPSYFRQLLAYTRRIEAQLRPSQASELPEMMFLEQVPQSAHGA